MTKLSFDWKKINDEAYCKWYEETRESNREECRKEVEMKYGLLMKRAKNPYKSVNIGLLNSSIRECCEKYGFEDAVMDNRTLEVQVY